MKKNRANGCTEEDLILYHYGELDSEQRRRVEDHLATCPACQEKLRDLERTLAAGSWPYLDYTTTKVRRFTSRVMDRVQGNPRRILPVWGGVITTVTAMIIALVMLRPGTAPEPDESVSLIAEMEVLQDMELLQTLELLEDLDLLQELEGLG
jgi:anti-sigma factor RsiW